MDIPRTDAATAPADDALVCPSSRPDSPGSAVFGIIDNRGMFPIVRYLDRSIPVSPEVLALAEGEDPNRVFRFTSPCQRGRCAHFKEGNCGLPSFVQSHIGPAQSAPSRCAIRGVCRWFHQLSFEACVRCPGVVTSEYALIGDQLGSPFNGPPLLQQPVPKEE